MIEITSWNESAEVLCHLKERVHNIKACATYSKINWQMICKTQSRWCTTCCYTVTVERHSILESTMWYEPSGVLCHLKELIYNIMACATYSQINQQKIFPENLQHIILMMYLESYYFTAAVKIHLVIRGTSWYECTEVLFHSKGRIRNIKTCATYSQIN